MSIAPRPAPAGQRRVLLVFRRGDGAEARASVAADRLAALRDAPDHRAFTRALLAEVLDDDPGPGWRLVSAIRQRDP